MFRVITVEREYGAGGSLVAAQLARRKGWQLLDQQLTCEIAKLAAVDETAVARREEKCDPLMHRLAKVFWRGSYERLQPWQLPGHAGDAGNDQGLVAVEPEGEADQDRLEGGEPRPLYRFPNGRGRHPTQNVPGDFAAHCGTTAAAATCASMRCPCSCVQDRPTGGLCPDASENGQISPSASVRGARDYGSRPRRQPVLPKRGKSEKIHAGSGFIWGIPGEGSFRPIF